MADGGDGNFGGQWFGEAVDAGADGGEGDGVAFVLGREIQAAAVAACEEGGLVLGAVAPDWANGVEDEFGGKAEAGSDFRVAGLAAVEMAAGFEKLRAGGAVDGSVYASAAEQRGVGGVDDGIDGELGDVGEVEFELGQNGPSGDGLDAASMR